MKPKIKINFTDFWGGFDKNNNFFTNLLETKYDITISDDPDYLFYSCFGKDFLNYDCVRIYYTGENYRGPDFGLCDYALGFDYLSLDDRYLRFPLYFLYTDDYKLAKKKHLISENEIKDKVLFCNFIYSNGFPWYRNLFFDMLSKYKTVDSGGGFRNNLGYRVENKLQFQKKYKFSIAFENDTNDGYTTEKIIQAFAAQTIPIYWGSPSISKEFNPNSFINCHDFDSLEDVVKRVEEIDNDMELFSKILKEPIYSADVNQEEIGEKQLLNFLSPIFDSQYDLAFRRPR
ncbi:glycosyltransferase family 10 domain-containing protein [Neobacillus sp. NRS-1170]|uniref:glycosyltransferase family 10 domain-containing protein n=1 Tax=Neobacillus sp. NRS-1170 TaxID=3233898 RepID=UPI003D2BF5CA